MDSPRTPLKEGLEAALIDEGLLPDTPVDPSEWGNAVPDRDAEVAYRRQVVDRIVARLHSTSSIPSEAEGEG